MLGAGKSKRDRAEAEKLKPGFEQEGAKVLKV
jgi:hypothetical protein